MIEEEFTIKQRVMLLYFIITQKVKGGFKSTWKFFVNLRYYRLRKRFIRNVNHVAGTVPCQIGVKMVSISEDGPQIENVSDGIGYNERKRRFEQRIKYEKDVARIRAQFEHQN